ncbi:hypothetical protein MTO96_041769 [Rhipicephalus appendiculatus]
MLSDVQTRQTLHVPDSDDVSRPFNFMPEPQECDLNEVWKRCVSSSCAEASCSRPTIGPACTADCRHGCYCADGILPETTNASASPWTSARNEEPIASWPIPSCHENEEWKMCVSSSCAEATCEKKTIGPECTLDCQQGCYCSGGFYRDFRGNCVREEHCPTTTEA